MRHTVMFAFVFIGFTVTPSLSLPFLPMIANELAKREVPRQDASPMNDAESRAEGGILPGLPSSLGGGGAAKEGAGTMFNQPMALMGGFTMLAMPAQDAMAMASSFQQFASNMPSLPGLPG